MSILAQRALERPSDAEHPLFGEVWRRYGVDVNVGPDRAAFARGRRHERMAAVERMGRSRAPYRSRAGAVMA